MDQVTIISVFVLAFALLLPWLANWMSKHPRWDAATKYIILGTYIAANLYETILFRRVLPRYEAEWHLLWSYRESLAFPDGLMSLFNNTVQVVRLRMLEEIILNILLYIPLGYLLPFVFKRLKAWHVVLIAFGCSVLTESVQLVCRIGWFDADDILNNTLGCVVGLLMYKYIVARRMKTSEAELRS